MMLMLYFSEGNRDSFIGVWLSMTTIVPRAVDELMPSPDVYRLPIGDTFRVKAYCTD